MKIRSIFRAKGPCNNSLGFQPQVIGSILNRGLKARSKILNVVFLWIGPSALLVYLRFFLGLKAQAYYGARRRRSKEDCNVFIEQFRILVYQEIHS